MVVSDVPAEELLPCRDLNRTVIKLTVILYSKEKRVNAICRAR